MSPWIGIVTFFGALISSIAIRVPHDRRSRSAKVVHSRKGPLEAVLLGAVALGGGVLPLLFAATPLLAFADHGLPSWAFGLGAVVVVLWLWLFQRAHADLGTYWSVSLELREGHQLVASGIYSRIRHPMYTAIFLHAIAQFLLLANWIAGPAMLLAFTAMFTLRLAPEERMLHERFGADYLAYAARTKRLIPGVW